MEGIMWGIRRSSKESTGLIIQTLMEMWSDRNCISSWARPVLFDGLSMNLEGFVLKKLEGLCEQ